MTAAPTPTSRHASFVSGSHLKIIANSAAVSAKFSTKLIVSASTSIPGIHPATRLFTPANTAVTTSDTSSRNAVPHTSENESSRSLTRARTPPADFFPGTFQMVSSALCKSANTPDAPKNSTASATTVAMIPFVSDVLFSTICSTNAAASVPIVPRNCSTISPRAASGPNARPAIATTASTSGDSDSAV